MNNPGLILSGTVSGYINYFRTPNVESIPKNEICDFDIRRFLSLNKFEKRYVISFTNNYIFESLYVGSLDSVHRPGLLAFSLVLPKGKKVISLDGNETTACYDLLNAVYNRFKEKNFIGENINPNIAVLVQDYYSDILANYTLRDDSSQPNINPSVDVTQMNINLGYILAQENDIPFYLASPCRKSYEGHPHVVLGSNVQSTIEEPPVEVKLYTVYITNTSQTLSNVRLDEKIVRVNPGIGQDDIDRKDFTYKGILDGEAGNTITAVDKGNRIELTYHFTEQSRNFNIAIKEGEKDVPLHMVPLRLVINKTGKTIQLATPQITVRGNDIDMVHIESENRQYVVTFPPSINLQNVSNGSTITVNVAKATTCQWNFTNNLSDKKVTLVITNKNTGEQRRSEVKGNSVTLGIPGELRDWEYSFESDYYNNSTPKTVERIMDVTLTPKPVLNDASNTVKTGSDNNAVINHKQQATTPGVVKVISSRKNDVTEVVDVEPKKKIFNQPWFLITLIVLLIAFIVGLVIWYVNKDNVDDNNDEQNTYHVSLTIYCQSPDGKIIEDKEIISKVKDAIILRYDDLKTKIENNSIVVYYDSIPIRDSSINFNFTIKDIELDSLIAEGKTYTLNYKKSIKKDTIKFKKKEEKPQTAQTKPKDKGVKDSNKKISFMSTNPNDIFYGIPNDKSVKFNIEYDTNQTYKGMKLTIIECAKKIDSRILENGKYFSLIWEECLKAKEDYSRQKLFEFLSGKDQFPDHYEKRNGKVCPKI